MQKGIYNKLTFLGTGTSSGIPTIGCNCEVCQSKDSKDKRLRSSIFIKCFDGTNILIDITPDFRQQMLINNLTEIDAVLLTHQHFDHIGGFDDIRAFNYKYRRKIPFYALENTFISLKKTFYYAFEPIEQLGGGIPLIDEFVIKSYNKFKINNVEVQPIPLLHGNMLVLGFRIGNMAYCTDVNKIPDNSYEFLKNLDILIIDALRYKPHPTHFTLDQALNEIEKIKPKRAYLIHMAHQIKHKECQENLPENVFLAFDGLSLQF